MDDRLMILYTAKQALEGKLQFAQSELQKETITKNKSRNVSRRISSWEKQICEVDKWIAELK